MGSPGGDHKDGLPEDNPFVSPARKCSPSFISDCSVQHETTQGFFSNCVRKTSRHSQLMGTEEVVWHEMRPFFFPLIYVTIKIFSGSVNWDLLAGCGNLWWLMQKSTEGLSLCWEVNNLWGSVLTSALLRSSTRKLFRFENPIVRDNSTVVIYSEGVEIVGYLTIWFRQLWLNWSRLIDSCK